MAKYICNRCGTIGDGYSRVGRSTKIFTAIINARTSCTACNSTSLLPLDTPNGIAKLRKLGWSEEEISKNANKSKSTSFLTYAFTGAILLAVVSTCSKKDAQYQQEVKAPAQIIESVLTRSSPEQRAYAFSHFQEKYNVCKENLENIRLDKENKKEVWITECKSNRTIVLATPKYSRTGEIENIEFTTQK